MVKKSFKKCGISNALDGTEDDLIWNNEELENTEEIDVREIVNLDDESANEENYFEYN